MRKLVIASRGSALALWQANHVRDMLLRQDPELTIDIMIIKTRGDMFVDIPLARMGGKGLFVKEIEEALLSGQADLAVHSMKDMPMDLPEGLVIGAVPQRETSADIFLSEKYSRLAELPEGALLGTSSLRRQAQALALRPDLKIGMLRGNVETRLRKMREGLFAGIILAAAGIKRLGLSSAYQSILPESEFIPAVGQGALGLEARQDRPALLDLLGRLDDFSARVCVTAERAFLAGLNGGCHVPIAGRAVLEGSRLILTGLVAHTDGRTILRLEQSGEANEAETLGRKLAEDMLEAGASRILRELYSAV